MKKQNKTKKSIIWDHKNDCYFCKRPARKWPDCFEMFEFEKFIYPYKVCEYCRSNSFRFIRENFYDYEERHLSPKNRNPWDYMKETQYKVCYLTSILSELKRSIRIAYNGTKSLEEYYYKNAAENKNKKTIIVELD